MIGGSKSIFGFLLEVVAVVGWVSADSVCNGFLDMWECKGSKTCIKKDYLCDSDFDCGENDSSDEDPSICDENCGGMEDRFQCANKKCIFALRACNGIDNCGDGSDESDETCANCNDSEEKIKCSATNKCVYRRDRCDGFRDCDLKDQFGAVTVEDNADEENCPPRG